MQNMQGSQPINEEVLYIRYGEPNKNDILPQNTFIKRVKDNGHFELWIQCSSNENEPLWLLVVDTSLL